MRVLQPRRSLDSPRGLGRLRPLLASVSQQDSRLLQVVHRWQQNTAFGTLQQRCPKPRRRGSGRSLRQSSTVLDRSWQMPAGGRMNVLVTTTSNLRVSAHATADNFLRAQKGALAAPLVHERTRGRFRGSACARRLAGPIHSARKRRADGRRAVDRSGRWPRCPCRHSSVCAARNASRSGERASCNRT